MPLFGRSDGDLVRDVPAYRRILQVLGRRTDSEVLFDQEIDVTETLAKLEQYNRVSPHRVTLFHLVMWGMTRAFVERPRMNRFSAGGRLYQRRGVFISYSAKKAMTDDAPIVAIKREMAPTWTFPELVAALAGATHDGRSDKQSAVDKELGLLTALPVFVLRFLVWLAMWLDGKNLLPRALRDDDPLFASAYVSNLGSLKLEACHHHLWNYGSVSVFCTIGKPRAVLELRDGQVVERKKLTLKYTFDERIEDGLYCARSLDLVRAAVETADVVA